MKWTLHPNKESWEKAKRKGIRLYLINVGIKLFGVYVGAGILLLYYLKSLRFDYSQFNMVYFVKNYLAWMPLSILIGIFIAGFSWFYNDEKFKD